MADGLTAAPSARAGPRSTRSGSPLPPGGARRRGHRAGDARDQASDSGGRTRGAAQGLSAPTVVSATPARAVVAVRGLPDETELAVVLAVLLTRSARDPAPRTPAHPAAGKAAWECAPHTFHSPGSWRTAT